MNDIRYGYIRQGYSNRGTGQGDYVLFRFINDNTTDPYYLTRSSVVSVPVNNVVDNLTWTKGSHTLGFGGNWRLVHNNRGSDANSYNTASTNPYWYSTGGPPDPSATLGLPAGLQWLLQLLRNCLWKHSRRDPRPDNAFPTTTLPRVGRQGACILMAPLSIGISRQMNMNGTFKIAGERGRT